MGSLKDISWEIEKVEGNGIWTRRRSSGRRTKPWLSIRNSKEKEYSLNKLVFPQIGEKFLPGNGQDAVGKAAYRVLADQD